MVDATALGLRPEAIPPNPETSEFFGVAHKGSALKGSRGLTFVSGDNIHEEVYTDTGPPSGSGIAKPVSPSKHFMVLQAQTPEFRCARSHSGGDHGHSSVMATNTKSPRCKRSAYTPEVGPDHPGCASGAAPSLKQPDSSGSANASPGIPAHPGTPILNPGENFTGRFGPDHPPAPTPPDQRVPTEDNIDGAADPRAPSLLARLPFPKHRMLPDSLRRLLWQPLHHHQVHLTSRDLLQQATTARKI